MSKSKHIQDISKAISDFKDAINNVGAEAIDSLGLNFETVNDQLGEQEIKLAEIIDANLDHESIEKNGRRQDALADSQKDALAFEEKTSLPEEINIPNGSNLDLAPIMDNMAKIEPADSLKPPAPEEKLIIARNAMVGKKYELKISELEGLNINLIENIIELEECGLSYNAAEKIIEGTPHQDGEFACPIIFKQGHNQRFSNTLRILVNPDPRSLWKNLEPPNDDLYQKSNFDFEQTDFIEYSIVAGSHRGRSHAHSGTHRDDDFSLRQIGEDIFFIAVADGAGSSQYSREGSRIACIAARDTVSEGLEKRGASLIALAQKLDDNRQDKESLDALTGKVYSLISQAVMNARNGLISKSDEAGHELKEYSTTLLFSIILKLEQSYFVASYSIGDGIIAHVSDNIKLLSEPDGGQFAGQTRFLTMPEAIEDLANRMKITFVKDLAGLYLMTDGISDPFFDTDASMGEREPWINLMNSISGEVDFEDESAPDQFKEWINFWSAGNHDDRTIAFVINKSKA